MKMEQKKVVNTRDKRSRNDMLRLLATQEKQIKGYQRLITHSGILICYMGAVLLEELPDHPFINPKGQVISAEQLKVIKDSIENGTYKKVLVAATNLVNEVENDVSKTGAEGQEAEGQKTEVQENPKDELTT